MPNDSNSDALAQAAGHGLSNWTAVEESIARLFDFLSGTDIWRALIILATIVSFEARVQVVSNLMMMEDEESDENLTIWVKLIERVIKAYKKRHEIAHFAIVEDFSGLGNYVIKPFYSAGLAALNKQKTLNLKEVKVRGDYFLDLENAIMWFFGRVFSRKVQHTESTEPEPDLIRHLRTLAVQNPVALKRLGKSYRS